MARKRFLPEIPTPWPDGTPKNHAGFRALVESRFSHLDATRIDAAYELSKAGHRPQRRKSGERYFSHPRDVAIILIVELGITDWRVIVLALLHDLREDTSLLSSWMVETLFGVEVLIDLRLLTKFPPEGYFGRMRLFGSVRVLLVKLADRLHNLRTLGSRTRQDRRKQITETRGNFFSLADLLTEKLPSDERRRGVYLRQKIEETIVHWEQAA